MPTLLVVDDEPGIVLAFRRAFAATAEVISTGGAEEGLRLAAARQPDVVVLDVQLPDGSGLDVLRGLRARDARCPVIFITGNSTTDTAIEAMKLGAYDYLLKPLELAHLRDVVGRAFEISRLMRVPALVAPEESSDDRADAIVGRCPAMQEVYKAIGRVAGQDVAVLIAGESGTGKELVARALYQHSRRATGPFLAVNCAALPESLLESELFGHEKGAFTGADRQRVGKFEQCNGGTLFLDEVGDLSPRAQSKVLRLLQDQEFERVGGNETVRADVRLIAATNQDLEAAVRHVTFRQDLFYRLSVFTIRLPPLRERGEDLDLLVHHYVRRFARELGKEVRQVQSDVLELLGRYAWPGNVRELQSVLKQALLHAVGPVLVTSFLPGPFGTQYTERTGVAAGSGADEADQSLAEFINERLRAGGTDLYMETVRRVDRQLLTRVLQHTDGNQVRAAQILGMTRGTLRAKIRDLGIMIARTVKPGEADDHDG
jgi:two-component system nitrogen regulation response regulator GlnG